MKPFGRLVVVAGCAVLFLIFYNLGESRDSRLAREGGPVLVQQAVAATTQAAAGLLVLLAGFDLLFRRSAGWPPAREVVGPVLALLGGLMLARPEWAVVVVFGVVAVTYVVCDLLARRWGWASPPTVAVTPESAGPT